MSAVAALPMYDWPEVAAATDGFWAAVRDRLRAEGVAAPEALERDRGLAEVWTDPGLVLGQACGLPLVRTLAGRVAVVGALDYGLPGCPAGWYRSAVVARTDDRRAAWWRIEPHPDWDSVPLTARVAPRKSASAARRSSVRATTALRYHPAGQPGRP
ncbi:MAG TPA: hypothetical protein VM422_14005 [Amaricoccus sp.]|nr:hypothetical protein [Amaricoccus sp.]